jgi:four helix bundle protein
MQEASETQSWLEFCLACGYMQDKLFKQLDAEYESAQLMLNAMEKTADKFCY